MNELGNSPADKNYKPSGIVNDLTEGQLKAVQLPNGTLVTEELSKSMTKAQEAALNAFPGQQFIHDRCVFRFGYEQAEKDLALTWGDVQLLDHFVLELVGEERKGKDWGDGKGFYTEVLTRFKKFKEQSHD